MLRDEAAFRAWLERAHGVKGRSVNDICSRTRRALGMIRIGPGASPAEVESALLKSQAYLDCTRSVRSQVKRAATLYAAFIGGGSRSKA